MTRALTLRREVLAELTSAELRELAGVHAGTAETLMHYCVLIEALQASSPVRCLTRGHTCINC